MDPNEFPKQWSQIDWLVDGEGEITIGPIGSIRCAAVASDGHNALAMLVRRPQESLHDLLHDGNTYAGSRAGGRGTWSMNC